MKRAHSELILSIASAEKPVIAPRARFVYCRFMTPFARPCILKVFGHVRRELPDLKATSAEGRFVKDIFGKKNKVIFFRPGAAAKTTADRNVGPRLYRFAFGVVLLSGLLLSGCTPNGQSQLDEQKEPHYLAGKNRLNAMDFSGALESFEKALQVNPRSASAHFEAGLLYEKNKQDYAAAIYHFERFVELRPKSDYAEIVNQRILACKQELAKTVSLGPVSEGLQREFEQLGEQNRRLRDELEQWKSLAARLQSQTNGPTFTQARSAPAYDSTPPAGTAASASNSTSPGRQAFATSSPAAGTAARMHTVKPGDTPTGIARKYGVKLDALMAANPKLDARRLQIGQTLNVPLP